MSSIGAGRFLELVAERGWEFVRRRGASGVVGIVAVTPAGDLLLVEQPRIPVGRTVIELPAGLVGDEAGDEDACAAAARELSEETGWTPAACTVLAHGPSSAGHSSEVVTLVRASGLRRTGDGGGVAGEMITVHAIPLPRVADWLAAQAVRGALIDHKVHAALWWLGREDGP
jgi:ADP-ribose pyrophosphatase